MDENKLIAEFMGRIKTFDIVDNDTYRGEVTLSKGLIEEQIEPEISHFEDRYSVTSIAIEENLQYHTSWDWLMPVVEKIKDMQYSIECQERLDKIDNILTCDLTIENLYDAVVEFIKQYKDDS